MADGPWVPFRIYLAIRARRSASTVVNSEAKLNLVSRARRSLTGPILSPMLRPIVDGTYCTTAMMCHRQSQTDIFVIVISKSQINKMGDLQGANPDLQIPVIDISVSDAETASRLADAVADHGFVFIRGNGLGFTSHILDDMFALVSS